MFNDMLISPIRYIVMMNDSREKATGVRFENYSVKIVKSS